MRYLGGAPGHWRNDLGRAPRFNPGPQVDLTSTNEDPTSRECRIVDEAERARPRQEMIEDELDDWYAPEDDGDAHLLDEEEEFDDADEMPGVDELAYAAAGLPLP